MNKVALRNTMTVFLLVLSAIVAYFYWGRSEAASPNLPDKAQMSLRETLEERYNKLLVARYLKEDDWSVVHHLEGLIKRRDMAEDLQRRYLSRLWENYLRGPHEYDFLPPDFSDSHGRECFSILVGRASRLADQLELSEEQEPSPRLVEEPEASERISNILGQIETYSRDMRASLEGGDLQGLAEARSRLDSSLVSYRVELREMASHGHLQSKYEPMVYYCLRRHHDEELAEIAINILLSVDEEVALRLDAAEYIVRFLHVLPSGDLMERLFDVLKSDNLSDIAAMGAEQDQTTMQIELLNMLNLLILDYASEVDGGEIESR